MKIRGTTRIRQEQAENSWYNLRLWRKGLTASKIARRKKFNKIK